MPFFLFLLGLLTLLLGASGVVNSAIVISGRLKISPLVVGITAVALGTSLPEIMVSIFGGVDNAPHLALGNIIGSNIVNIGLILGISVLFDDIRIGTRKTQSNMILYFLLSIITYLILMTNKLDKTIGLLFIIAGFALLYWQIRQGMSGALDEDKRMVRQTEKIDKNLSYSLSIFIISLVGLVVGGKLLVDEGVVIAKLLNISETVIGLTMISFGTSLPELAVSIIGIVKHQEKLVVGNILGSNLFNILFGGGILGLYQVHGLNSNVTLTFFLIFSVLFSTILYIFHGREIPRYVGGLFLTIYIAYLLVIF